MDGSPEKKPVRVTIFQQPYTLRSSGESGDTEALAQAVDTLMHQIAARTSNTDPARVAVLAALHLADRARVTERELNELKTKLADLDRTLSTLLPPSEE